MHFESEISLTFVPTLLKVHELVSGIFTAASL